MMLQTMKPKVQVVSLRPAAPARPPLTHRLRRLMSRAVLAPLGIAALGAALVGCAEAAPEPAADPRPAVDATAVVSKALDQAQSAAYESQVALLSDGSVTLEDYETSVQNYVACMTERGFVVDGPMLNPADNQLFLMQALDGDISTGASARADTDCRKKHVDLVEHAYRTLTEPRMDSAIVEETHRCLGGAGLDYAGDESNFKDFVPDGVEDEERLTAVSSCVDQAVRKIYPEIPLVALGF